MFSVKMREVFDRTVADEMKRATDQRERRAKCAIMPTLPVTDDIHATFRNSRDFSEGVEVVLSYKGSPYYWLELQRGWRIGEPTLPAVAYAAAMDGMVI
ncbi:MAG: hypothetical protein EHM84_00845 [Lysobacterales bacterium]|nr:MAG: hypothetical protein EHM84_00845 [Xanthomonadales bacterium]